MPATARQMLEQAEKMQSNGWMVQFTIVGPGGQGPNGEVLTNPHYMWRDLNSRFAPVRPNPWPESKGTGWHLESYDSIRTTYPAAGLPSL